MERSKWPALESLLIQLVECPPEERESCIATLCADDVELATELKRLLDALHSGSDFLEAPVTESGVNDVSQPERIGPYKVIRAIRHGGMGSVYLAQRDDAAYDKRVAIKLILRGLDNRTIVSRFRRERQILASLDHPNIARLLDGGATEDGLPYLVMEYIEGQPLTQWVEDEELSLAERLKIFRSVCAAVHAAHQHLVIHLDLKPANILVTAEGEPKLLDFGIARLLEPGNVPETGDTHGLLRPLTPDYASPEQIRGERTTITSDVYSLGVVLFELLTGERPRNLGELTPAQMLKQADVAPPSPRAVAAQRADGKSASRSRHPLSPDLDNIVAMAMRADPQRRYASAAALSEDIERYLLGFPVAARPDTVVYRTRKFLERNRAGVAAALLISASLVAGLIATSWQVRVAARQRARAQRDEQRAELRLNNALNLTHSLLFEYYDAISGLSGSTAVRMQLVRETLTYLEELEREASDSPDVRHQLALAYLRIGDVQGRPYSANLGETTGALSSYQHAVDLLTPIAAAHPNDAMVSADLASAYDALGRLKTRLLDYPGARTDLLWALELRQTLAAAHPGDERDRTLVASTWQAIGDVSEYQQDLNGAFSAATNAEAVWRSLVVTDPSNTAQRGWAASLERVGAVYESIGQFLDDSLGDEIDAQTARRTALDSYLQSLKIARDLVARDPANVSYLRMEADVSVYAARMLDFLHRPQEAYPLLRTGVSIFSDLSVGDAANHESQFDLIDAQCQMASLLAVRGEMTPAIDLFDKSVARGQRLLRADPDDLEWLVYIGNKYATFEQSLRQIDALPQALRISDAQLAFEREAIDRHPHDPRWRDRLATDMLLRARLLLRNRQPAAAQKMSLGALAVAKQNLVSRSVTAEDLETYGVTLLQGESGVLQNPQEAIAPLEQAAARDPLSLAMKGNLARAYLKAGRRERAAAVLRQILARLPLPEAMRDQTAVNRDLDFLAAGSH